MVWFFKRKPAPVTTSSPSPGRVVVSRSDFDASVEKTGQLVYAVVKFVNAMNDQGAWRADELPMEAQVVYASDYYLAQVNNGGHAQFIWNGRNYLEKNCALAIAAFRAMGAHGHRAIMEELAAWLGAEGEQAFAQTGLVGSGKRAPILEALDRRFFDLQKTSPLTRLSEDWIRTWTLLTVVEDAACPAEIAALAAQNPRRDSRREIRALFPIISRTTQAMEVGFGLALSNLPVPAILSSIQSGRFTVLGGEELPVFRLMTTAGEFQGVPSSKGVAIYPSAGQQGQGSGLPPELRQAAEALARENSDVAKLLADIEAKSTKPGSRLPTDADKPLSVVPMPLIEATAKLSAQTNVGIAISFLLKDCFGDATYLALGALAANLDRTPYHTEWRVDAKGKTLVALVSETAASLQDERGKVLARIPAQTVTDRLKKMSE